jgi:hypothetical protein
VQTQTKEPAEDNQNSSLSGVFLSEQTSSKENGDTCHYLLRFYEGGLVLQTGICSASVVDGWPEIQEWFNRGSDHEMGRGDYFLDGDQISFTTTAYFSITDQVVTLEFNGEYLGDKIVVDLLSHLTKAEWSEMEFTRLNIEP